MALRYDDQHTVGTLDEVYLTPEVTRQRALTVDALQLKTGEAVLDLGCGTGLLSVELANAIGDTGKVLGMDPSQQMLALAAERCAHLPQVQLQQGGAQALVAPDASFDAAACVQVLLYVAQVEQALSELRRVLRPGGRLVVIETHWSSIVLNGSDPELTRRMFSAWDAAVPSPGLPARLGGLLQAGGFTLAEVRTIPFVATHKAPGTFSALLLDWTATHAEEMGSITAREACTWRAELDALEDTSDFFFAMTRFAFIAVRT